MTKTTWTLTFCNFPCKQTLSRKRYRKQLRQWTRLLFKLTPEELLAVLS